MNESSRDPLYQAELAQDSGPSAEPFMKQALDSLVDDLLSGLKPRGLDWNLHSFLNHQPDIGEITAAAIISGDFSTFKDMIEGRLRRTLEDDDAVHDLAAQFANEPEES